MMKKHILKKPEKGILGGIALGATVSLVTLLSCLAVFALMVINGSIGQNRLRALSCIALVIGSIAGTTVSAGMAKQKAFLNAVGTAAVFYLLLIGMTTVFFEGNYSGAAANGLCILIGSGIAVLPKIIPKKSRPVRVRKMRYR